MKIQISETNYGNVKNAFLSGMIEYIKISNEILGKLLDTPLKKFQSFQFHFIGDWVDEKEAFTFLQPYCKSLGNVIAEKLNPLIDSDGKFKTQYGDKISRDKNADTNTFVIGESSPISSEDNEIISSPSNKGKSNYKGVFNEGETRISTDDSIKNNEYYLQNPIITDIVEYYVAHIFDETTRLY